MTEGIETGFLETMIKSRLHAFGDLGRIPEVPEVGRTKHRGFCEALTHTHDVAVIAEVKKASPSAGSIAPGVKVVEQAAAYERGGAVAVSVLTEPVSFGGSFEDLDAVAHGVSIPVLCKDFVCTPHQLELAHCYGADAVLLMVSVLGNAIGAYISAAEELGLETLVEVHDDLEYDLAVASGARVLEVNSRDLRSLRVDLESSLHLVERAHKDGYTVVAASGINGRSQVRAAGRAGADAVLVGTSLMRSADPQKAVKGFMGEAAI